MTTRCVETEPNWPLAYATPDIESEIPVNCKVQFNCPKRVVALPSRVMSRREAAAVEQDTELAGDVVFFMGVDYWSETNQPPRFPKVAGVLRSRAETTATTFSRPRRSDLDMRRRHPDLSAWWRRCFGQRQPLYTGFSCPDSDLSERHQKSQLPSRPQVLCAFTCGNVPFSIQRLRESTILWYRLLPICPTRSFRVYPNVDVCLGLLAPPNQTPLPSDPKQAE